MDTNAASRDVGAYFRLLSRRQAEMAAHALVHGEGKPSKNPFTGAEQRFKAPASIEKLWKVFTKHNLQRDPEFVAAVGPAIAQISEGSIRDLLLDLERFQRDREGGPDPEICLQFSDGTAVDIQSAVQAFEQSR